MALNFYYLPIALAATPVALALLPRLSRLHQSDSKDEFTGTFMQGLGLALFMAIPAAVGFVVLADPIAHTIAAGQMASPEGLRMIAAGLAALALGLVGETTFYVTTQAAYARGDTRTPLVSMALQAGVCLTLVRRGSLRPAQLVASGNRRRVRHCRGHRWCAPVPADEPGLAATRALGITRPNRASARS